MKNLIGRALMTLVDNNHVRDSYFSRVHFWGVGEVGGGMGEREERERKREREREREIENESEREKEWRES